MSVFNWPELVVGAMRLGVWGVKFIEQCLELGLDCFDHADIYGSYTTEAEFGQVLKAQPDLSEKIRIITKCGIQFVSDNRPQYPVKAYSSSKAHILKSVENSLRYLSRDYLDVLLIHRPDYLMVADEIVEAFRTLQDQGKVLHFGVSNFNPQQFNYLHSEFSLITNQIEFSLLQNHALDDGTLLQAQKSGVRPMAWSPLGGAKLFEAGNPVLLKLQQLAEKYSCEPDALAYAWLRKHPSRPVPVLGSSKLDRIKIAMSSLQVDLERQDWYALLETARGEELP
jgi:predicted oxidoreductase